jgi:chromosome partitioning protein
MQTIAIANQKGGVAKTTTTLTLGAILAENGRRVLLVDLDPQSSLTQSLGINAPLRSIAEVIGGAEPGPLVLDSITLKVRDNLFIAPADIALSLVELSLISRLGREQVVKSILAGADGRFDVCLIDCPPSLGLLAVNGLVAADGVIIPAQPAPADLRGLRLFLATLTKIKTVNRELQTIGVILTQFDGRNSIHHEALIGLESSGLPVLSPVIPRSVKVQEAAGAAIPLTEYDPKGKATAAYRELCEGLEKWLTSENKHKIA